MGGQPALLTILNIHKTGTNRAQPGQARYPLGASTVPNMGKHRAHFSKIGDHFPVVWFYLLYKINSGTKFLFYLPCHYLAQLRSIFATVKQK